MSVDIIVRMGELAVECQSSNVLTALGLGSCIGLCAYDPISKVSAMAHIVLPESMGKADSAVAKSADVAIPSLVDAMVAAGAQRTRIRVALAGGAQLFSFKCDNTRMDVGARNIQAATGILASYHIRPVATDLGGSTGRTVRLYADTGQVTVRTAGQPEVVLAELGYGAGSSRSDAREACTSSR